MKPAVRKNFEIVIESRAGLAAFSCAGDERILYAGLANGLSLPYDCATGTCGLCKARVKSGSVDQLWPESPALAKLQRDKGDILMCQSRPTSNCAFRVPGSVAAAPAANHPCHNAASLMLLVPLTADVLRFDLDLAAPITFAAGQFAVLTVPGISGGRSYSMVNHAASTPALEFVIKRKSGGAFSDWLFSAPRIGAGLDVFGPLGRATLRPHEDGNLVAIAGGSGIAGVLSILDHATSSGHFARYRGQIFFGVRTLADAFYLDRLAQFVAAARGALDVVVALSHEAPRAPVHPNFPGIRLASGFVHEVADAQLSLPATGLATFVAGPPPMVDGAIRVLIGRGVPSASIRYDKFS